MVNYPATATFLRVADGVNDANNHVNFMIQNCPATRLVLGGYSQGAAAIDYLVGANPGSSPGRVLRIPGLNADPVETKPRTTNTLAHKRTGPRRL